jgi:hypothetical protein
MLGIVPERSWGGNTWIVAGEDEGREDERGENERERWIFERGSAATVMDAGLCGGRVERASEPSLG